MSDVFIDIPKRLQRVEIFHAEDKPAVQSVVFKDLFAEETVDSVVIISDEQREVHTDVISLEEAQADVQKAYEQGFADGQQVSNATFQPEIQRYHEWVDNFDAMAIEMRRQFGERFKDLEASAVGLAVEIARFIVMRELETDSSIIITHVQKALGQINGIEDVRIRVHPSDLDLLQDARVAIQSQHSDIRQMSFTADETIERGGCIVETPLGSIDAQIRTQLDKIREAMLDTAREDSRQDDHF